MKKKILVLLLIALVVTVIAVGVVQRANIKAGLTYFRYSDEEIEQQLTDSYAEADAILQKLPEVTINPLTEDQRQKLSSGEITEEEAIVMMLGETEEKGGENAGEGAGESTGEAVGPELKPADEPAVEEPVAAVEDPEIAQKKQRIAELVARVWVLRDSFGGRLENIKANAIADYTALPDKERTSSAKSKLVLRCIDEASALESQCDSEMDTILAELTTLLQETGGDPGIADEVKAAYANEKAAKKAYYINLYTQSD